VQNTPSVNRLLTSYLIFHKIQPCLKNLHFCQNIQP
jgi:hypothetical protein